MPLNRVCNKSQCNSCILCHVWHFFFSTFFFFPGCLVRLQCWGNAKQRINLEQPNCKHGISWECFLQDAARFSKEKISDYLQGKTFVMHLYPDFFLWWNTSAMLVDLTGMLRSPNNKSFYEFKAFQVLFFKCSGNGKWIRFSRTLRPTPLSVVPTCL